VSADFAGLGVAVTPAPEFHQLHQLTPRSKHEGHLRLGRFPKIYTAIGVPAGYSRHHKAPQTPRRRRSRVQPPSRPCDGPSADSAGADFEDTAPNAELPPEAREIWRDSSLDLEQGSTSTSCRSTRCPGSGASRSAERAARPHGGRRVASGGFASGGSSMTSRPLARSNDELRQPNPPTVRRPADSARAHRGRHAAPPRRSLPSRRPRIWPERRAAPCTARPGSVPRSATTS
jgi:hypothetical protein